MDLTDRILRALRMLAKIVPQGFDSWVEEVRAKPAVWARLLRLGSLEDTLRHGMIHGLGGEVEPPDPASLRQNIAVLRRSPSLTELLSHVSTRQNELREEIDQLPEAAQRALLTQIQTATRLLRDGQRIQRIKQSSGSLPGRKPVDAAKELAVCRRVDVLERKEHLPKAKAVQLAADEFDLGERKVWMILSKNRAQAMTGYVTTEPIARDQKQPFSETDQPAVDESAGSSGARQNKERRVPGSPGPHKQGPGQSR